MLKYFSVDQPDAILDAMCSRTEEVKDRYGMPAISLQWLPSDVRQASGMATATLKALGKRIDTIRIAAVRRSVRTSVTRSVVLVVFGLAGAFVGGAAGSLWGALVANLIAISVAWRQLQAAQRGHVLAASD